jgi:hypothetical protein
MIFTVLQSDAARQFISYRATHRDGPCVLLVLGFDTDSATLNSTQQHLLDLSIRSVSTSGRVLEMYARADRTGAGGYNRRLSGRRLRAVQDYLMQRGVRRGIAHGPNCKALGERFEAAYGVPDETATRGGRSVWMFDWVSQDAFDEGPTNTNLDLRALTTFGRAA